ncbi:MAG: hypothetical protein HC915_15410 [Anaerolineae bacterium]|nr:hypothetical protein [Anaerolineae bacterium]
MTKKKTRRPNLPEETLARARAELYGESAAPVAAPAESRPAPAPAPRKPAKPLIAVSVEELKQEYGYVLRDLQSMGLLAILLVVVMVLVALVVI